MSNLRTLLQEATKVFVDDKNINSFAGSRSGELYRNTIPEELRSIIGESATQYKIEGSVGRGNFAEIPWICIFDRKITESASKGVYLVQLTAADGSGLYFVLGQGTTYFQDNFGGPKLGRKIAQEASFRMRELLDIPERYNLPKHGEVQLKGSGDLGLGYEAGSVAGIYYDIADMPAEEILLNDLSEMLKLYDQVSDLIIKQQSYEQFVAYLLNNKSYLIFRDSNNDSKRQAFWWLNANPLYWKVSDLQNGEEMPYELFNEQGFKRRIYQNFLDAKPGDPVIFYETSPTKQIVAIGAIGRLEDEKRLYFKKSEELQNPIDYSVFKDAPELKDFTFMKNPTGSLFKLREEEYNYIMGLIHQDHKQALSRTRIHPLNKIIYGAPGTGKTYSTIEYAVAIVENRAINHERLTANERSDLMRAYNKHVNAQQIVFTTFHQSYAYEEFVQGIRPVIDNGSIAFELRDGIFKLMADRAIGDLENNYVLIIDEINRGNISKIFGELITLVEEDKRWDEKNQLSAMLPSGYEFKVPSNLYIIGTMNSADKSISLIDAALRRRFIFEEMIPDASLIDDEELRDCLTKLNEHLKKELRGTDLLIGHSYFMNKTLKDLPDIMNNSIIPLLYEYFYDDEDKIVPAIEACLDNLHLIDPTYKGRKKIRPKS